MRILVTGAKGFIGRNLVENLNNIRAGKNQTRPELHIEEVFEYDIDSSLDDLDRFCSLADFVFHFAGVNRPKEPKCFQDGNVRLTSDLLQRLEKHDNAAPVMLSSSIQASLSGRFGVSEYGLSKESAERLFFEYAENNNRRVLVYRFPNTVGKWVRPNYNSAVGTFCHNIANNLPITVNDPSTEMEILFVEDLIEEMYDALEGKEHHCHFDGVRAVPDPNGRFCFAPTTYQTTLGEIVRLLYLFHDQPKTLMMPEIPPGSFKKKLFSVYLSYLPKEKVAFDLKMISDDRGSFTELLKTSCHGQVSVNVVKPGVTKGKHWHNCKWEFFVVVSGHGLIRERKIGTDEIIEIRVSGEKLQVVNMLPGYTHDITNESQTEDLVMLIWANEVFDPEAPDTFFEEVCSNGTEDGITKSVYSSSELHMADNR